MSQATRNLAAVKRYVQALESAVERVRFCEGVYTRFVMQCETPTDEMDADKATRQLLHAVNDLLQINSTYGPK